MSVRPDRSRPRLLRKWRARATEGRLLRRIRAARNEWGLVGWSDRELREAVAGLADGAAPGNRVSNDFTRHSGESRSPEAEKHDNRQRNWRPGLLESGFRRNDEHKPNQMRLPRGAAAPNCIPEDTLVRVFAVVDETIRRRLGLWKVFDLPDADDEPSIADARRKLAAAGRGRYPGSDLLLSAEFYQAARRRQGGDAEALRFRPTDQQLLAGQRLCEGRVVEMAAGEGKTVAAVFPAALYGLLGRTVHVVTANDYLAARDAEMLAPVYRALGLTVGSVLDHMAGPERRESYTHRIIYGTLREFAFDYLRDRMVMSPDEQIQGPLDVAIIDEADQTLLDEAITPMVIAGAPVLSRRMIIRANRAVRELAAEQARLAVECRRQLEQRVASGRDDDASAMLLARAMLAQPDAEETLRLAAAHLRLRRRARSFIDTDGSGKPRPEVEAGLYCAVDAERGSLSLLPEGVAFLEARLGYLYSASADDLNPGSRRAAQRVNLVNQVHQLLRAHLLLRRGVEYVVDDDRVVLVDRDTGRPRPDTHYQDGLHPAVEAKEGVTIHPDHRNLGEISVPGFLRCYRSLAGLTGTAAAATDEFRRLYGLKVAVVAETRPTLRRDLPTRIYAESADQLSAVVDEVRHCHRWGRPVLVAARTVAQSEVISQRLIDAGIRHRLLNAATNPEEADIVRQAGQPGAVTVATNMAGRGTDVVLPGGLDQRLLNRFVAMLEQTIAADPDRAAVEVRANTSAEADLLARSVEANPLLSVRRAGGERLTIRSSAAKRAPSPAVALEFGLGFHLVSAEFNDSPRVALQLQGRSGRQGAFGSTRSLLVRSDRWLAGLEYGVATADPAGRICWEGPELERQLRRRREEAQQEDASARAYLLEYVAVLDHHADAYYTIREETLVAGSDHLVQWADDAAGAVADDLARKHFPGLVGDDYTRRFDALAAEMRVRYDIAADPARGHSLDGLGSALAELLRQRLAERREQLGAARFGELARLLLLQVGDELWENHRAGLRNTAAASRLEARAPKTAIAEYIIAADDAWRRFREEVSHRFMCQMLTFPITGLTGASDHDHPPPSPLAVDPKLARLA